MIVSGSIFRAACHGGLQCCFLLLMVLVLSIVAAPAAAGPVVESAPPSAPEAKRDESFLQGRMPYYVRYAPGRRGEVEKAVVNAGGKVTHRLPRVESFAVLLPEAAAEALANRAGVALVEPVPEHRLAGQTVPYNIDQYQARDVWDKNRDGTVDPNAPDGSGVKFCIIDSGLYAGHDDFAGVTLSGVSQISGEDWFEDGNGHGTHVAGTANAVHNDIGVVGTMPGGAELIILKVFNNEGAWVGGESNLGAAAETCRDMGANVLSMSLGGSFSTTENNIFQDLYDDDGILNIAAAGNSGDTTRSYPASYDSVISVGAIDRGEEAAAFTQHPESSYDPDNPPSNVHWDVVELAGGGVEVLSTWPGPPHNLVPQAFATVGGTTHHGDHIEESGFGDVSGPLVHGDLCTSGSGDGSWNDAVVICERGQVAFSEKINEVRSHGGVAAIIYNDREGGFLGTCFGDCDQPSIPVISLTQTIGQELVANHLGESTNVVTDSGEECTSGECDGGYLSISGTSMATPGVAAGVALVWDACGGPAELTNKQIRQLLRDSARDLTGTHPSTGIEYGEGWDQVTGWGLVQLLDAQELGHELYGSVCPIGLDLDPPELEVCGLDDDTAQTTVKLDDQFLGSATLSVTNLPGGANGSFDPNPVEDPIKESLLTLGGLDSVAGGSYNIEITASDDADSSNNASGLLELNLSADMPGQPLLQMPADGATEQPLRPTLSWEAATEANEYLLEVATDSGFTSIVHSEIVTDTTYAFATDLDAITTYYWRVSANNYCGNGDTSETSSFTTINVICELVESTDVPKAIEDASGGQGNPRPETTESVLSSPLSGALFTAEMIELKGTHTWISDLSFTLVSPDGTAVEIMERSCGSENDFHLSLDDDASGAAGGWPCPPNDGGTYKPSNPLAGFIGTETSGTWTLQITDHFPGDDGELEGWGLNLCVEGAPLAASITEITLIDPADEQTVHDSYTVHVEVTGDAPSGTVDVSDGTGGACQITLSDGSGNCEMSSTTVGTKIVTASYTGDDNNGPSSANQSYEIIADAPDSLAFAVEPTDTAANDIISPAVEVHVLDQHGNRVDWDNDTIVSLDLTGGTTEAELTGGEAASVVNGVASYASLSIDLAGSDYRLVAIDGGSQLANAESALFEIFETSSTTTITDIDPADSQVVGENYTVTVAVTGEEPTGLVTVSDGAGNDCQINLDDAESSCSLTSNLVGGKTITAQYPGDAVHAPSSDTASYTIVRASTIVEITAVDPAESQQINQPYTVHVSVAGYQPAGDVTVSDGFGASCQFKVPDNSSCELSSGTIGETTLVASYEGDDNNEPASDSHAYEIMPTVDGVFHDRFELLQE